MVESYRATPEAIFIYDDLAFATELIMSRDTIPKSTFCLANDAR